jgi:hypothetical protein
MSQPARQVTAAQHPAASPNAPDPKAFALWSGFEGREELLGKQLLILLKTIAADVPYQHHLNDAVLKAHMTAIQFAKNEGILDRLVAHDVKTLEPINKRIGELIARTGNREYGLIAMFERTDCWYQLVEEYTVEPGCRRWKSPFNLVLSMSRKTGQHDLTEEEIHEQWTRPRLLGYAQAMKLAVNVSHWNGEGGWLSCELA